MQRAVVTGSNKGIGLALCQALLEKGYEVIALCRSASPELKKLGVCIEEGADVTDERALQNIAKKLSSIDLLLNVAGQFDRGISVESVRRLFEVNTLGPFNVTMSFLPHLKRGSKIVMITSRLGSIEDNLSGGKYGYRISRAGLNILGKSLAVDLRDKEIAVGLIHPGRVQVKRNGFSGDIDATTAAERILERTDGLTIETSGTFWHSNGEVLPW